MSTSRRPAQGRIVLYRLPDRLKGLDTMPAVITRVHEPENDQSDLGLMVMYDSAAPGAKQRVPHGDAETRNSWFWPPIF